MLQTFSLGKICILIGIRPEKRDGLRDPSNHQGKGMNQTSLMARFALLCRSLICMHSGIWILRMLEN